VTQCPAPAGRPRFDIADIVRQHRAQLEVDVCLTEGQRRALSAIALCRTAALGGHLDECPSCGFERPSYNSCRNRHCPKCQALAQEQWIDARSKQILPVRHFHVVFTLPAPLRPWAKFCPEELFDALFHAVSETLLELGDSRLNARLGVTMVLHTWTREIKYHPHVHSIVTAGGLSLDGVEWKPANNKYLFPVKVMGALLRGKMMDALRALHGRGAFDGADLVRDPQGFDRLMAALARVDWLVYAKKPFRRVDHVLQYLGRYTHRVAISNSRLLDVTEASVKFRTKDGKTTTIPPVEFLRRFVQHVLPEGFHKIRHAGLYAGANVANGRLQAARAAAGGIVTTAPAKPVQMPWDERLLELTGRDVHRCPRCGSRLEHLPLPTPNDSARAPPRRGRMVAA
jgi:hypothetical protein